MCLARIESNTLLWSLRRETSLLPDNLLKRCRDLFEKRWPFPDPSLAEEPSAVVPGRIRPL